MPGWRCALESNANVYLFYILLNTLAQILVLSTIEKLLDEERKPQRERVPGVGSKRFVN